MERVWSGVGLKNNIEYAGACIRDIDMWGRTWDKMFLQYKLDDMPRDILLRESPIDG